MHKTELFKWLLLIIGGIIVCTSVSVASGQPIEQPNLSVPAIINCGKSYSNILRALRDNWESPITYLKKRGYLPKNSEMLFANDAGNNLLIQVEGENANDVQNNCEKNVRVRNDNAMDDLTNAYKTGEDPFSYITEPKKGFLGNMKDTILGLFSSKKSGSSNVDNTNILDPQKVNERKYMTNISANKPKQINSIGKEFKPTKDKFDFIVQNTGQSQHSRLP